MEFLPLRWIVICTDVHICQRRNTPGNSQTQLGTREPARLSHADLLPRDVNAPLVQLEAGSCPWTQTQRQMTLSD